MRRARKKKPDVRKKYTISDKQMDKVKKEITEEAVHIASALHLAVLAERGWTEDEIVDLFETVSRYAQYLDDHVVKIKEIEDLIERKTGIKIKGGKYESR